MNIIILQSPMTALLVAAVFAAAGLVKGVVGLGLPTLSMALLAFLMPAPEAAALLIVPSLVTNVWQLRPLAGLPKVARRLAGMQAGIVAGTIGGAWWFGAAASPLAARALGAALVGYAAWGLMGKTPRVAAAHEGWLGLSSGAATGVVTALTGVFVLPAVPYLQSLELPRDSFVQAMGLSFTVSTIALGLALASQAAFSAQTLTASAVMLVPALLGMAIGQHVRKRLSVPAFRRCFFIGLALLGAYSALRGG